MVRLIIIGEGFFSFPPGGGNKGGGARGLTCGSGAKGTTPFRSGRYRLPGRGTYRQICGKVTQPAGAKSLGHRDVSRGAGQG